MLHVDADIYRVLCFYADKYNVNRNTILAIAIQESGLNPWQIGDQGRSFGAMQVNLDGAGYGLEDHQLLHVAFNFDVGCAYYERCVDATTSLEDAISAYNQGIGGVQKNGRGVNTGYWTNVLAFRTKIENGGVKAVVMHENMSWED